MKQKEEINPGGINGTGKGVVNINSADYRGLQEAVILHANKQSKEDKIRYGLLSLRYQMERYVSEKTPPDFVSIGEFLKSHLAVINVRHKTFAQYIELEESNLSSIIKGRRKVNIDLAFKLGRIFNLNPDLWLLVQSKNELLKIDESSKSEYDKFRLDDLLKKAS